jgi:hypothetical protein
MDCSSKIVHKHRPGNALVLDVAARVGQLLLQPVIRLNAGTGMRLANNNVDESNSVAPVGKELLERLDRARRDRSGV